MWLGFPQAWRLSLHITAPLYSLLFEHLAGPIFRTCTNRTIIFTTKYKLTGVPTFFFTHLYVLIIQRSPSASSIIISMSARINQVLISANKSSIPFHLSSQILLYRQNHYSYRYAFALFPCGFMYVFIFLLLVSHCEVLYKLLPTLTKTSLSSVQSFLLQRGGSWDFCESFTS